MKLFIVESPKKCKTLKSFLGDDYTITASMGHIRAIPKKGINIDIKNGFTPVFEVISDKRNVVRDIIDLASQAEEIILATDPDREGEAIAWHIYDLLPDSDRVKCKRVSYGEITKKAVLNAIKNAGNIDMDKVDAQKARQILDRLIGYKISPVLWNFANISGSSAGRVQSIALNLVCDKQKKINAFKPEKFWHISALLRTKNNDDFWAKVITKEKDNRFIDEKVATTDFEILKDATYNVDHISRKQKSVNANPPFDTQSLQRTCSSLFRWSLSKSKTIAQKLYEQGKVTYIRTDSFSIADEAIVEVRGLIAKAASKEYLPSSPNKYQKKSKAAAQEAHECIRPTHIYDKGDDLYNSDEKKMYKLIRDRFLACQMSPMLINAVSYHITTSSNHKLITTGQTIKFDGWQKVYRYSKTKEDLLPNIDEKDNLNLTDINKSKHSTKPPARYNEASLGDQMEASGVGRPSTRGDIITGIQKKGYVVKEEGKDKRGLVATTLGMQINDYLKPNFKDFFMDLKYTSQVEDELTEVADGKKSFLEIVKKFYDILCKNIKDATGRDIDTEVARPEVKSTGVKCSICKTEDIVSRNGRFGQFYACNDYKGCKTIYIKDNDKFILKKKNIVTKLGKICPRCSQEGRDGELIERNNNKTNETFIGCSKWPICKFTESVSVPISQCTNEYLN